MTDSSSILCKYNAHGTRKESQKQIRNLSEKKHKNYSEPVLLISNTLKSTPGLVMGLFIWGPSFMFSINSYEFPINKYKYI